MEPTVTTAAESARLVLSDLDSGAEQPSFPSSIQIYRLGLVLFRIRSGNKNNSNDDHPVVLAYRELIESLSDDRLREIFGCLQASLATLVASTTTTASTTLEDLAQGIRSVEGLIGAFADPSAKANSTGTSRLCRVVCTMAWISTLAAAYDRWVVAEKTQAIHQNKNDTMTGAEIATMKHAVLSCLSRLLLDGIVLRGDHHHNNNNNNNREQEEEDEHRSMEETLLEALRTMEMESTDCLRDLQEWQRSEEPFRRTLEETLASIGNHPNPDNNEEEDEMLERAQQREYILSMLESAQGEPSSMALPVSDAKPSHSSNQPSKQAPSRPPTTSSPADTELDRRVQQVLQILPHFGEGFVEVALGLHRGDAQATVATLLDEEHLPPALKRLDPKLPRRKREFRAYQTQAEEQASAREARQDVKERVALEERQKQEQYEALVVATASVSMASPDQNQPVPKPSPAGPPQKSLTRKELRQQKLRQQRARDEYDDDYDDQYDDIDVKLGAADDGFTTDTNMTFEQVKLYNQVVQEDESDAAFWESNRNTNQTANKKNKGGEKNWGPDKIKGGRVVGPDGKIVRKPGGVKKKKGGNNNNRNNNNNSNSNNNNHKNNNGGNNNNQTAANNNNTSNKKKPKTKPRSDNRINRQRDRKLKKQGNFGVQE